MSLSEGHRASRSPNQATGAKGDTLRLDDPRAGTIGAYLRILRDTLPRTFLLENVPGLAYRSKSEGLELIEHSIERINHERGTDYNITVAKLNAADYGIPQVRERVVVGARDGTMFRFPQSTHQPFPQDGQEVLSDLPTYTTAWDALGNLEDESNDDLEMRGKWADLLPAIPEGQNYLFHTERDVSSGGMPLFGWRRRFWSFLLKLSKNKPSWTVQAQPGPAVGPFHWKNRRLSAQELCRIQTIPDSYEIKGRITDVQRQLGNAVPAEVLVRALRQQLFGHDDIESTATLIPQLRRPIPDPEPVAAVPAKYHHLAGKHEAHPGTGKGFAAEKRQEENGRQQESVTPENRQQPSVGSPSLFWPSA